MYFFSNLIVLCLIVEIFSLLTPEVEDWPPSARNMEGHMPTLKITDGDDHYECMAAAFR